MSPTDAYDGGSGEWDESSSVLPKNSFALLPDLVDQRRRSISLISCGEMNKSGLVSCLFAFSLTG
jgi:hypothetical protein